MRVQSYRLRLKTAADTFTEQDLLSNSNDLCLYFKGEHGLTQTLTIPLKEIREEIYENMVELVDVGNLTLAHLKLAASNVRWKFEWIELEGEDQSILNFPINRWLDSNRNPKIDVLIKEGPAQLAPLYTITVYTGTISSSVRAHLHLALIGDGASTVPFDLHSNSTLIPCTTEDLFQSGSKNRFFISPLESVDVGQLFRVQLWCDSQDKLPYYCESVEVLNHLTNETYFFLVNHWFGPNLEHFISTPVINRKEESKLYTISVKTTDISDASAEKMVYIHMKFANQKSHEEALSLSETHQIAFEKDHIDFFMFNIDDLDDSEIINAKICLINQSSESPTVIRWHCDWIEIRDIFYQRNYCYIPSKTIVSIADKQPYDYTSLERILPCAKNI